MNTKKALGAVLFTAIFATSMSPVSAIYDPNNPVKAKPGEFVILSAPPAANDHQLVINGKALEKNQAKVVVNKKNETMIPIRVVAEQLGYKLNWNQSNRLLELARGNQFFMIKIGEDRYNVAKMNTTLGHAPELISGKTYVPLSFFSTIMKEDVKVDESGMITIGSEAVTTLTAKGVITGISITDMGAKVAINGISHGLVLGISAETKITNAENQELKLSDLKPGMSIEVVHDATMNFSLPPQTAAKKIVVKESPSEAVLGIAGEITEETLLPDGSKKVLIKGEKITNDSYDLINLIVKKDTPIIGTKDNQPLTLDQLKKGTKVYGFFGPMVTKSYPATGGATKILIEN